MDFFVAGATGRTGRAFVAAARAAGHDVTAFVRDRTKAASLGVTLADSLDALTAQQVVVSALGGGELGEVTASLIDAARERGVARMLAVVGAGVLQADAQRLRNEVPGYPPFLKNITVEHAAVYRALREAPLEWTLVCVPNIIDGAATGAIAAKADYLPDGRGQITTGDIAAFLVCEASARSYVRSHVGLNTI